MAEYPSEAAPAKWHIPVNPRSDDIPWLDRLLSKQLNARAIWRARIDEPQENELINILHEVCHQMGIKKIPNILIYDSYKPNASSNLITGNIMFATNLLEIMSRDQIKAVMGHELNHHIHRMRDFAFIISNVVIATVASEAGHNFIHKLNPAKPFNRLLKFMADTLLFDDISNLLGFSVIQSWWQRRHELEADLGGVKVAGAENMADSIAILDKRSKEILIEEEKQGKFILRKYIPPFLRSHPSAGKRLDNIAAHTPKSFAERCESDKKSQNIIIK